MLLIVSVVDKMSKMSLLIAINPIVVNSKNVYSSVTPKEKSGDEDEDSSSVNLLKFLPSVTKCNVDFQLNTSVPHPFHFPLLPLSSTPILVFYFRIGEAGGEIMHFTCSHISELGC